MTTDVVMASAREFLGSRVAGEPFFSLLSTPALHGPLESRLHHRSHVIATRLDDIRACSWQAHVPQLRDATRFHVADADAAYQGGQRAPCDAFGQALRFEREAMAVGVDELVGSVVAQLKRQRVYNDTLLFFLSDNGGLPLSNAPNYPLRGGKNTNWEGGGAGARRSNPN